LDFWPFITLPYLARWRVECDATYPPLPWARWEEGTSLVEYL